MSDRSTGLAPSKLTAVLGPTNTGKTHLAVERMLGHASGMIGLPLRLHLAVALVQPDERFVEAMDLVIARFAHVSEKRLVTHPHRLTDRPDETFAEQKLGLEYVYGTYHELDDLLGGQVWVDDPVAAQAQCLAALREEVGVLHAHLATL